MIWFFISFVGPALKVPDAGLRLSPSYDHGTPLLHGHLVLDTLVVVAIVVAALGLASARFVRKDIGV